MDAKRITLFAGHYGSGKTNIAINFARRLGRGTVIADLDIVNPYFRTKDSAAALASEGIELVVSEFANSNVDFPALPKEIYSAIETERGRHVVIDVGGDDRGALALGRYTPEIVRGGDYDMFAVVNASRPLTRTPEDALEVMREIEAAGGLCFTGIVNNTNLGFDTTADEVVRSCDYAERIAAAAGLKVAFTCCARHLAEALAGKIENLFPIDIQRLYYQLEA